MQFYHSSFLTSRQTNIRSNPDKMYDFAYITILEFIKFTQQAMAHFAHYLFLYLLHKIVSLGHCDSLREHCQSMRVK